MLFVNNFHKFRLQNKINFEMPIISFLIQLTEVNFLILFRGKNHKMEQNLQTIAQFLTSKQCILNLNKIDYPTLLQQKMILSYFEYSKIVARQHDQIIRVLHTANQKNLESIVLGIVYTLLLNPQNPQLCLQHLKTLKSQAWQFLSNNLEQILLESFEDIKIQHRIGLAIIFSQLSYYHILKDSVTIMMLKTIDCFDFSQTNLTYIQYALDTFSQIFDKTQHSSQYQIPKQNEQCIKTLSRFLFFKLLRLSSNIICVEDKSLKQIKEKCLAMVTNLWNKQQKQCIIYGYQLSRYLQQLQSDSSFEPICTSIRQILVDFSQRINWNIREVGVSSLLPIRVQTTIIFMMRQKISRTGIWYQVNWLLKDQFKKGEIAFMLLVDIARWVAITNANMQQKIYILEYLYQKCRERSEIAQFFKQALFLDWFDEGSIYSMLYTSLNFISYTFSTQFKLGEDLLVYLLAHKNNQKFCYKLRTVLLQAGKQGIIKLNMYLENDFFSSQVKGQLQELLSNKIQQGVPLQFDPSESAQDIQYESQFSDQNNQNQISRKMSVQNIIQKQVKHVYSIKLNSDYVEDMQAPLKQLLQNPQSINLNKLLEKVIQINKKYRKEGESQQIELTIKQTVKIIYLMFNSQFQQFQKTSEDNNVLLGILRIIISDWKLNTFRVQIYKKIVKTMNEMFPVTEFSFWKVFLENFRRGPASHKQVFDWLFQKQKHSMVRESLELFMGINVRSIQSNAASYSIWNKN